MKALVKTKAEEGIWLQDMPEPECGNNDVIVKIHKTAICGTDIQSITGMNGLKKPSPFR